MEISNLNNLYKFFVAKKLSLETYTASYLSNIYISDTAAYKVTEYLPISADYDFWKNLESNDISAFGFKNPVQTSPNQTLSIIKNTPFEKIFKIKSDDSIILNLHSAAYWDIRIDDKQYIPKDLDKLGRPVVKLKPGFYQTIKISYQQTPLEQFANILTLLSGIILLLYSYQRSLWKKIKIH